MVPLLAHGEAQGEAGRQVAGLIQGRAVSRSSSSSNISRSSKPAAQPQGASSERRALQRRLQSSSHWPQSMRRTAPATSVVRGSGGVGGHRHRTPVGGSRSQTSQRGLEALSDQALGHVSGAVAPLQVPEVQGRRSAGPMSVCRRAVVPRRRPGAPPPARCAARPAGSRR